MSDALRHAAEAAHENAYAPYSGFRVGVALRAASGRIHVGCNVENAAYPQGTCAETGAIATMIAAGDNEPTELLILVDGDRPVPPCGGCRQRLAEFAAGELRVIMACIGGAVTESTLADLLPDAFGAGHLGRLED